MRRSICLLLTLLTVAPPAAACTAFLFARGGVVLAGNNEDWTDPDTKIWFVQEEDARYGRVYFGFGNWFPQGGMNAGGLFFDGFALGGDEDPKPEDRLPFDGNLVDEAMKTCAAVDEVVRLFEKYDFGFGNAQLMFGDATGAAVIIERTAIHPKTKDFQVTTNFRLSRTTPANSGCRRWAAASNVLDESDEVTVAACRDALAAAQQPITVYSNVYDLVNGKVHLWLNHDFTQAVTFDLARELEHGERKLALADYFADAQAAAAKSEE